MSAEIFPTPLDWVALAVLLVSLLAGFMRGFLIEAIALCGWVGGFFLARAFAADVAAWLPMENSLPGVRLAAGSKRFGFARDSGLNSSRRRGIRFTAEIQVEAH